MTGFLFGGGGTSGGTSGGEVVQNVKTFGAAGTGLVNDAPAIQAAIDWTSADTRGTIYFPEGVYLINAPLTFNVTNSHSITFRGDGRGSRITGNFNGFLLDRSITNFGNSSIDIIENLWFQNGNPGASAGCVRWNSCSGFTVRNCVFEGMTCIGCYDSTFTTLIETCQFTCLGGVRLNSEAIHFFGGGGLVINACDVVGFHHGITLHTGGQVSGCRFENNGDAIMLDSGCGGATLIGNGGEANDCMIYAKSANKCLFINNEHNGHAAAFLSGYGAGGTGPLPGVSGDNDLWSTYGFVSQYGTDNVWFHCNVLYDSQTISNNGAAYQIREDLGVYPALPQANGVPALNSWIDCNGGNGGVSFSGSTTVWDIANLSQVQFLRCTPPPDIDRTFAGLPSIPTFGTEFYIKDALTAGFLDPAKGGGTGPAANRKVRATANLPITSITRSGSIATITTPVPHGLTGTPILTIAGALSTPLTISSITRTGSTATATTAVAHGLTGTKTLKITGATQAGYNHTFSCDCTVATNKFSFNVDAGTATPATGSPVYQQLDFSGTFPCTVASTTTLTYTVANAPNSPAVGTKTYSYWQIIG